jgi:hypothetical protein
MGRQRVNLSWTNKAIGARVEIERATAPDFATRVTFQVPATSTRYTDGPGLARATTYYYRVFAVSTTGSRSAPSNVASATTT